ncbi:MAG: response regulator transcription factor [Oscillospiraceae bacterium]
MRLLIAEDDPRLLKTLIHIFESNKFIVDGVSNGGDALAFAQSEEYDGLVLDIMMPCMDGIEVLSQLRKMNVTTPALFLTARAEISQRVEGLDAGADDYLPKPFAASELLARVRAMLRRKDNYVPDLLSFGGAVLNRTTYQFIYDGNSAGLCGKEFQILEMLMQSPKAVIPTERFLTHIWGWDSDADPSVVWVHISNLRRKIGAVGAPLEIRFARGAGYVLEEKR